MKNLKRIASLVLALVMVFSLAISASAEPNTNAHTITINNTTAGYTYEAYRVFEGTLEGSELQGIDWSDGVNAENLMADLKKIDAFANCVTAVDVATVLSGITAENDATTQAFADAVAANLATSAGSANTVTSGKGYVINVTGDGYYFVKTTGVPEATDDTAEGVHTRYILKVVGDVTVTHKGSVPTVEKAIVEGTSDVESTDKNIGDTVTFKLTATLPSDYNLFKTYTLTFHDSMSKGLKDAKNFVVAVDGVTITNGETTYYTVNNPSSDDHDTTVTDDTNIDIVIADVKAIAAAGNGSVITVTYEATVDSDAVIGNPGNDNKVYLEYSNNPNEEQDGTPETGTTPEDKVVVFTYELDVTKVDGVTNTITLANAKFSLFSSDDSKIAKFEDGKLVAWVDATTVTADDDGVYPAEYTLTTGADGIIKVVGLDAGTYNLKETAAPTGYNLPESPFVVVITATTTVDGIETLTATVNDENATTTPAQGLVAATIENNSGATLPSTGGIGTTLFYVFGGIMVLAAVVLLVTKKRMSVAE